MTRVYDATKPVAHERVMGPGNPVAHIQNPMWRGYSLCLVPLTGHRRDGPECPDCLQLAEANRTWIAR